MGARVSRRAAVLAALALDSAFGEPPSALHPTVAMGRWISTGRSRRRSHAPFPSLLEGGAVVALGAAVVAGLARAAEGAPARLPGSVRTPIGGALLKPALSLRALLRAGAEVERALVAGDLCVARRLLAWHLVSRDTADLSAAEVAGSAIESLAENLSDGLIAPLLAFRAGGLPAAYLYRLVNTADAMLGYRTPELEWFGKPAARADDVLNWIPARTTALLIALASPAGGGSVRASLRVALRDAHRTASPNAGWPMAAMAGALGVRLSKRGVYVLHPEGREPSPSDLRRARRIVLAAGGFGAIGAGT